MSKDNINPKAIEGRKKQQYDSVPPSFMKLLISGIRDGHSIDVGLINDIAKAMAEGHGKYGKFNWREDKIELMDYYNSSMRHYLDWSMGDIIDKESGLNHFVKILSGFCVVHDAIGSDFYKDDRSVLVKSSEIDKSEFSNFLVDWFNSDCVDMEGLIYSAIGTYSEKTNEGCCSPKIEDNKMKEIEDISHVVSKTFVEETETETETETEKSKGYL